jgi:protease PrsW
VTGYVPPDGRGAGMRRWAWVLVLVVGVGLFVVEERTLLATQNPNFVPSAILLGSGVVPLTFLAFVYGRRLPYTVPGGIVAGAAFVGGVIGTIVAGTLEFDVARDLGGLPMLGVAFIEELSKLVVPLVLVLALRHRTRADGLLLGVACGAGFAALETMGYAFVTLLQSQGSITDTVDLLLLRGLLSPAGHMAWTGLTAAALAAAAASRWRPREVRNFVLVFAGAVVLHALWDGVGGLVVYVVLAVVGLGLLAVTAHRAARVDVEQGLVAAR